MNEGRYKILSFTRAQAGVAAAAGLLLAAAVLLPIVAYGAKEAGFESAIGDLRSKDPVAREAAGKALRAAGADAVPDLLRAVDRDASLDRFAFVVIREIGAAGVPAVLARLSDPQLGAVAANALPYAVPLDTGEFVPELLSCVRTLAGARAACGMALLKAVGPKARKRLPVLVEALKDPEPAVRLHAAAAIGRIGSKARSAVPALTAAAGDADPAVRAAVEDALRKVRG